MTSDMTTYEETASWLLERLSTELHNPQVAIICGSGLGGLASMLDSGKSKSFSYSSIPHFPRPTVEGHAGELLFGFLGSVRVVLMVGRAHYYEGHAIDSITYPVRIFKLLGVDTIVVTNAAGGLNPEYNVGDIVLLRDHLFLAGLAGVHPLRGPNLQHFGARFPPLSDSYDLGIRRAVHAAWKNCRQSESKRSLREGVYAFVGGPSYETRAECRMLHILGADVVGMSTVPEVIVARHAGIRVLALSLVTNKSVLDAGPRGDDPLLEGATAEDLQKILEKGRASHEEVLEEGRLAAIELQNLVGQFVRDVFDTEGRARG